jgi:uncharacterized protein YhbP (UPF0306 family)
VTVPESLALAFTGTSLHPARTIASAATTTKAALTRIRAAILGALNTANGYIAQVNGIQTQAYNDAVAAAQTDNCRAVGQPSPQPSIS